MRVKKKKSEGKKRQLIVLLYFIFSHISISLYSCCRNCPHKSWPCFQLNSLQQKQSEFLLPFLIVQLFSSQCLKDSSAQSPVIVIYSLLKMLSLKGLLVTFLNLTEICKYPQSNAMKKFYIAHVKHVIYTYKYRYINLKYKKKSFFIRSYTTRNLDFLSRWTVKCL